MFTTEDTSNVPSIEGDPLSCIDAIQVHSEGVAELLSNINPGKSHGPDNLPAHFLKEVSLEIVAAFTLIFQASLDQGTLPVVWRQAIVVPIFKKGRCTYPCNYRPISLICICTKILEHIVYSSIFKHLQRHAVLCDAQHGFRPNRSCDIQLIITVNDFADRLNK